MDRRLWAPYFWRYVIGTVQLKVIDYFVFFATCILYTTIATSRQWHRHEILQGDSQKVFRNRNSKSKFKKTKKLNNV